MLKNWKGKLHNFREFLATGGLSLVLKRKDSQPALEEYDDEPFTTDYEYEEWKSANKKM